MLRRSEGSSSFLMGISDLHLRDEQGFAHRGARLDGDVGRPTVDTFEQAVSYALEVDEALPA
jgi:hypothetical protein